MSQNKKKLFALNELKCEVGNGECENCCFFDRAPSPLERLIGGTKSKA